MPEKSSIFRNLCSLLHANESENTPLENYFTKIVVHLLNTFPEILYAWLKDIELINDTSEYRSATTEGQQYYHRLVRDQKASIIDIRIKLQQGNLHHNLIFVEAKIDAPGNLYQLQRYAELLNKQNAEKKILLFITKHTAPRFYQNQILQNIPDSQVTFKHINWDTFHKVLQEQPKNTLVDEVITFMHEQGMGPNKNLTREFGADLSGLDLKGAGLQGFKLPKSNLQRTNLSAANLGGANLREADLQDANLSKARLVGADLTGANLCRTDLREADLRGAYLTRTNLSESNLSGIDSQGANFSEANLSGAYLRGVSLQQVNLRGVKIDTTTQIDPKWRIVCELHNQKCPPVGADLAGLDLQGIKMAHYHLPGINLSESNLNGADLSYAEMPKANLSKIKLIQADLRGTELHGANLSRADLSQANLRGADLPGANLSEATLSETTLRDAKLQKANISGANLCDSNMRGANLSGADLREANLNGADLTWAIYDSQTQWPKDFILVDSLGLIRE